ncbi:MAG: Gfo/Idh/MocA family oxidoreductase [Planctomycetes bacterium]|nr:Gfo/Idh/MocA family oxidoreductase [Planctomycetota bacterium]
MTRIGIYSSAHLHAGAYAAALRALPGVELTGVYDPEAKRGKAAAKSLGARYAASPEQLFDLGLDGVIICSENVRHRGDAERALDAGLGVLCEKPLATKPADALAMVRAAARARRPLMTAFPCRYSTPLREARRLMREGALGAVLAAQGTNRGTNPGGWFVDPELSGGGAVMDHTVHVVDVLRWILEDEVASVYAEATGASGEVEDHGLLLFRFEQGTGASLDCSWSRPGQSFPTWGDVTLSLIGEQGNLHIDAFRQHAMLYSERAKKGIQVDFADDINAGLIADFVAVLREEKIPEVDGIDGLRAVEVVDAAYRSIASARAATVRRAALGSRS